MPCPRPPWFRWWLFPATSIVHFGDELFAGSGFYKWVTFIGGAPISLARFACATLVAFASITIASWVARKRYDWLLFALAAIILTNALTHLAGSLATHSYSPGTASGLVLWLPLGGAILYRGLARNCARAWCLGLAVGTAMNVAILLLTMNLGRMS
jgi:small-conductance mechanosensitive channel